MRAVTRLTQPGTWRIQPACPQPTGSSSPRNPWSQNADPSYLGLKYRLSEATSPEPPACRHAGHVNLQELPGFSAATQPLLHPHPLLQQLEAPSHASTSGQAQLPARHVYDTANGVTRS